MERNYCCYRDPRSKLNDLDSNYENDLDSNDEEINITLMNKTSQRRIRGFRLSDCSLRLLLLSLLCLVDSLHALKPTIATDVLARYPGQDDYISEYT